jgi:hypothetical protein
MDARIETGQKQLEAEINTGLVDVETMDLEANPEKKKAIVEQQEIPNKEATKETIGALED